MPVPISFGKLIVNFDLYGTLVFLSIFLSLSLNVLGIRGYISIQEERSRKLSTFLDSWSTATSFLSLVDGKLDIDYC